MNSAKKRMAKEINIKEIFNVLKKRLWIILLITAITTLAGGLYSTYTNTLLYQSSTKMIIGASPELMKTLQVIIKDSTVLGEVAEELNLNKSAEGLSSQINVQTLENSQVVSISVVDTDPQRAADIANKTAEVFKEDVPKIIDFNDVRILSEAKVNGYPINETQNRTIILSFVVGLIVSIGFVFFLDSLDDTFRSDKDVEDYLDLPVLGHISKMSKKNIKKQNIQRVELNPRGESVVTK